MSFSSRMSARALLWSFVACAAGAIVMLVLAMRGVIEWKLLEWFGSNLASSGLGHVVAALLTLLAGAFGALWYTQRDRRNVEQKRDPERVQVQLMLTCDVDGAHVPLTRDYGVGKTMWMPELIGNSDICDYLRSLMKDADVGTAALVLEGDRSVYAYSVILPFVCGNFTNSNDPKTWCVVFPAYWTDEVEIDCLRFIATPEAELEKYLDVNYCFACMVERPSHVTRVLLMRDTALKHFATGGSPFARRQLSIDMSWTPDEKIFPPDFERENLREAMVTLGLVLPTEDLDEAVDAVDDAAEGTDGDNTVS